MEANYSRYLHYLHYMMQIGNLRVTPQTAITDESMHRPLALLQHTISQTHTRAALADLVLNSSVLMRAVPLRTL